MTAEIEHTFKIPTAKESTVETTHVDPGRIEPLKNIMGTLDLSVECPQMDNMGILHVGNQDPLMPEGWITVIKLAFPNAQNGIRQDHKYPVSVTGQEILLISSTMYDDSLKIYHKLAPPKRELGQFSRPV